MAAANSPSADKILNIDLVNINRLRGNILGRRLYLQSLGLLKGSGFEGSEVDLPLTSSGKVIDKVKSAKRLPLNREPGTF